MAVSIKSSAEIELMREAGRILALTQDELAKRVKPGMSTLEVDRIGEEIIRSYDSTITESSTETKIYYDDVILDFSGLYYTDENFDAVWKEVKKKAKKVNRDVTIIE